MPDTAKNQILEKLPDAPVIGTDVLQKVLVSCFSPSAVTALRAGREGLVIGEDNRMTLLRMLDNPSMNNGVVQREKLVSLIDALTTFLEQQMADQPEGHLWIILCCVYLSMILREPMHPQRFTRWYLDGGTYRCPAKEISPGSVCLWCVCKSENE